MLRIAVGVCALLCISTFATADQWGHWRGPIGNGTTEGAPPTQWSSSKNVKWKVAIPGAGSGSPVVCLLMRDRLSCRSGPERFARFAIEAVQLKLQLFRFLFARH